MDLFTKTGAARLSVASNTTLVVLKFVTGILTGSVSVMSEAVHSGVDLVAAGIALYAVKAADRPADQEHPFGHGKIENISAVVEAMLILAAAAYIVYEGYERIFRPRPLEGLGLAVGVMAFSTVANILVSWHLLRVAARTDSAALEADGHHLRVDVFTSLGVMITVGLIYMTRQPLLDPVIAIVVAGMIGKIAWDLTIQSGGALLDHAIPADDQARLRQVLDGSPGLVGYHRVRARKSGSQRHIDLHLLVDAELSLRDAHALATDVENRIRAALPSTWVVTHVEPATAERLASHAEDPGLWKGLPPNRLERGRLGLRR